MDLMKKILISLAIFFISLFCFSVVEAANVSDVVINEIAWMGTSASANDEWLELYNNTSNPITLDGWLIKANDGTPDIKLAGTIPANGYYLLERTDDNTLPNVTADLIYKGALGNTGEDLKLYDNQNNLIDEVNCAGKWFAGDNTTKQTMETLRQAQGENRAWQTSENPGGTPKAQNSTSAVIESGGEARPLQELKEEAKEVGPLITYPTGVVLNEILPNPEGPDEINEWIELYNSNNFEVDLSGWKIEDIEGAKTIYIFDKNAKIAPNGYLILKRPDTKITLNNSKDGLNLLRPDNKIIDSLTYNAAPKNQSYNKANSGWQWSASLTPGNKNIIQNLPNSQKSGNSNKVEAGLAAASESTNQEDFLPAQTGKNSNPWFLFFTALAITIISAAIVLLIKLKFLKKNVGT